MPKTQPRKINHYTIFIDGASRGNPGNAGIGVVIIGENQQITEIKKFVGKKTNNQAEYLALITALETFRSPQNISLNIYTDSQLLANQINNLWKVRNPGITRLFQKAKKLLENFYSVKITHIPREKNKEADTLANLAIDEYLKN